VNAREGLIREERPEDHRAVTDLVADAFGRMIEARIVERLRDDHPDAFGPALVAEIDDDVVGYVCCSAMRIDEAPERRILGLGPIAVLPSRQGLGIGSALMRRMQELVEVPIVLLGDPAWYRRFGFQQARRRGIVSSWGYSGNGWMGGCPHQLAPMPYRDHFR